MKKTIILLLSICVSALLQLAIGQNKHLGGSSPVIVKSPSSPSTIPIMFLHPSHLIKLSDGITVNIRASKPGEFNGSANNKVMNDTKNGSKADEVDNTDEQLCTVTYKQLSAATMDQDVMDESVIGNIKVGGCFSLYDFQQQGKFNIADAGINPVTIGLTGAGIRSSQIVLNNPNAKTIDDAVNTLQLTKAVVKPSINGTFQFTEVYSQQDLNLKVGIAYKGIGYSLTDKFNFSSTNKSHKFFLDFKQTDYTAQAYISPNGYFSSASNNEDGDKVYVDKITFGKRVMVFFETNEDGVDLTNSLNVNSAAVTASVDALISKKTKTTNFKVVSYGTKTTLATVVTGWDNLVTVLNEYFKGLNNVSLYPAEWGKPLTYSMKYLNGDVAVVSANVENIPRRLCVSNPNKPQNVNLNLMSIELLGDADLYGHVEIRCFNADDTEIPNMTDPKNASVFNLSQQAHLNQNIRLQTIASSVPSSKALSFKVGGKAIEDGAYIRVYAWLQDYDSGSGDDYFVLHDISGNNDKYKDNYRQILLKNVKRMCDPTNPEKRDGCKFVLEASEADGGCKFNFQWSFD